MTEGLFVGGVWLVVASSLHWIKSFPLLLPCRKESNYCGWRHCPWTGFVQTDYLHCCHPSLQDGLPVFLDVFLFFNIWKGSLNFYRGSKICLNQILLSVVSTETACEWDNRREKEICLNKGMQTVIMTCFDSCCCRLLLKQTAEATRRWEEHLLPLIACSNNNLDRDACSTNSSPSSSIRQWVHFWLHGFQAVLCTTSRLWACGNDQQKPGEA